MPEQTVTPLVYLDTETTSLDKMRGDVIEASWAVNDGPVKLVNFPHTLEGADPKSLEVNRYHERNFGVYCTDLTLDQYLVAPRAREVIEFRRDLTGATIVAENCGFDMTMLLRKIGYEPWHYRPIELSSVAMVTFGLDRPEGLHATADRLRALGFDVPVPDHSAVADVLCLRYCHQALSLLRHRHGAPTSATEDECYALRNL